MRHPRLPLLSGAFVLLLIGSCRKNADETVPTVDGGAGLGDCPGDTTVTDIDGNVYPVVLIGSQYWMAKNLRTTRYRDGTTIPNVTDSAAWGQLNSGAWCNYENDGSYDFTYGKLYNWFAANPNICPLGWHVPTDAEWTVLTDYLGGVSVAGGKMKSTTLWNAPNTAATNESCFSGLPGGRRDSFSTQFGSLGAFGYWWSASEGGTVEMAQARRLYFDDASAPSFGQTKRWGHCIRCVKD